VAPEDVLDFWFGELKPAQWWAVDPALDRLIDERFGALHDAALAGELHAWRATAEGRLAEVIVLDQFSRNRHRGTPRAFAADPMALALAQEALAQGIDRQLPADRLAFLLMPFMHSESRAIHREAEPLFRRPGLEGNLESALRHRAIIDRFGRYPHRNAILGRESSAEEIAFLATPGSSF
jgi:uncharacterized protein (DUF924 family)